MSFETACDKLAAVISARKIKKISCRLSTHHSDLIRQEIWRACKKIGINDFEFCSENEDADVILVDQPTDISNKTVIEISRSKSPRFEDELISSVFDIETVNRSEDKRIIADKVVTLAMNTCVATSIKDRVYFTTVMPENVEKWTKAKHFEYNRFSHLYKKFIVAQYIMPVNGMRVNVIVCKGGEAQLIRTFVRVLNLIRPHNTITFNGQSFDWPFIIRSGFRYDIEVGNDLSFLQKGRCHFSGTWRINSSQKKLLACNSGFINSKTLDLDFDSMLSFLHIDLHKYNSSGGSLNEICKNRLGEEKIELGYEKIPSMLYGKDERLMIYNVQDTELTSKLFFDQYFLTVKYYLHLENICGIPYDTASNMKRSAPTIYVNYCTNIRNRIVEKATLKPKYNHVKQILKELARYFLENGQKQNLHDLEYSETRQILSDYHNGALNVKKDYKKFPPVSADTDRNTNSVLSILRFQINSNAESYNTIDFLVLLSYLSNTKENFYNKPFKGLIKRYLRFFEFTDKNRDKLRKRMTEECDKLMNFMYYVVSTYKHFSPFQDATLLWIDYFEYFKPFNDAKALKLFYDDVLTDSTTKCVSTEMFRAITECKSFYKTREFAEGTVEALLSHLDAIKIKLELKLLAFDGAYIEEPIIGVNLTHPVICVDIASQYPSCILHLNMGPGTEVSLDYVLRHNLTHPKDIKYTNKRRTDDAISFETYIDLGMSDYVRDNYVFFLSEKEDRSLMSPHICEYKKQIDTRLAVKKLIKTSKTTEEKKRLTEKSDALKVAINSYYGNIGNVFRTFNFMPAVTAKGRHTINTIKKTLKQLFGEKVQIRYGDTDSSFFSLDKSSSEIANMNVEQAYRYFNGEKGEEIVPMEYLKKIVRDVSQMTDKNMDYKSCFIIHSIFDKFVIPILNDRNPKEINLELEKVMLPFVICSKKKYVAFRPLDDETLTKGMSNATRVSFQSTRDILSFFIDSIKKEGGKFKLIDLYHYIGENILKPIKNGTIDLSLVSKSVSHNTTKYLHPKVVNMINRLKKEGKEFFFDTIKEVVVYIEPVESDEEWSIVTVNQFRNGGYKLHTEKLMLDILSEMMTILSTSYTTDECALFEALTLGYYDPTLKSVDSGNIEYTCSSHKLTTAKKRKLYEESSDIIRTIKSECESRTKRRRVELPGWIKRR